MSSMGVLTSQKHFCAIDEELMNKYKFKIEQLMEMAGLSCAHGLAKVYPVQSHRKIMVFAGPGNNGGDGLVASRHLQLLGYDISIVYPKRVEKPLMESLIAQCEQSGISVSNEVPSVETIRKNSVLLDALFGFSFKGEIRAPFDEVIRRIVESKVPVVSVDIPSGWDVEKGDIHKTHMNPEVLISLTAPKLCAKHFTGKRHFIGGRFIPPPMDEEHELNIPVFPGSETVVEIV